MDGANGNALISLKQMEFSLKQFLQTMGQPNFSIFYMWKKVWVDGYLEKKQRPIVQWKNYLKQLQDGSLHRETAVADILVTVES